MRSAPSPDTRAAEPEARVAPSPSGHDSDAELPGLHIRVLSTEGRSIVHVTGELDVYTAAHLRDSLARLISGGARHIVVDLRGLSFMGASGIGVLVAAWKRLQRNDGTLVLRSAPPGVQKLIEITGLDATLTRI